MHHACAARFDVMKNLKKFWKLKFSNQTFDTK